jgi:hypothetical protein
MRQRTCSPAQPVVRAPRSPRLSGTLQRQYDEVLRAHQEGVAAREAHQPEGNPYDPGTDRAYYWREGYFGRPFTHLTWAYPR